LNLHVDEMVFRGIQEYKKKYKFINIEGSYEEIAKDVKNTEHDKELGLEESEITPFCLWLKVIVR
jgi:hypothetical protein